MADPGRHFVGDYRAVYGRLGAVLEEVASHSFAERADFLDSSFALPVLLLGIAQFTRRFPAEILGVNLAWQFLDLSAFGPAVIRDLCDAYALPGLGDDLGAGEHVERGRELGRDAALQVLEDADETSRAEVWTCLLRGVSAGISTWTDWFDRTQASAPAGPPDPRQEMIDLLWRKAPHAFGYHAEKTLGSKRIDEHLNASAFDGPALLEELARSRWVKPGRADRSGILRHLVKFGGPMLAVFSPTELRIIENWIESLPLEKPETGTAVTDASVTASPAPAGPSGVRCGVRVRPRLGGG